MIDERAMLRLALICVLGMLVGFVVAVVVFH